MTEYEAEKRRRVYYQSIVYDVCNLLDQALVRMTRNGTQTVCGTADCPTNNVRDTLRRLILECDILRDRAEGQRPAQSP